MKPVFAPQLLTLPQQAEPHIVEKLIAERTRHLSAMRIWPLVEPMIREALNYRAAVSMADTIATLPAREAFEHVSRLLALDARVDGLDRVPKSGPFLLLPNHPTGIADGMAVFDALKAVRPDMVFFANRDALRVNPRFADMVIPVEWRPGEKSRAKTRDTLQMTARAVEAERAIVLFPSGRIAHWNEGRLTERPWQMSAVSLARRYDLPIVPLTISARNSGLFYLLSRLSNELRDMTVFHELLNKRGRRFDLRFGEPLDAADLDDDPQHATDALKAMVLAHLDGKRYA